MSENAGLVLTGSDMSWHGLGHPGWSWGLGFHDIFWLTLSAWIILSGIAFMRTSGGGRRGADRADKSALHLRYARGVSRREHRQGRRNQT